MWPFTKPTPPAEIAAPPAQTNPYAFVVPSYRRGGPYSQEAVPQGGSDRIGEHPDSSNIGDTITKVQRRRPFGTYPPAGLPPDGWLGYKQDNWQRSQRDEDVLFGIPQRESQHRVKMAKNPYFDNPNNVNRPQHAPHDYSFLRNPDWNYLGKRELSGEHYSQAQTVTDQSNVALKGLSVAPRRRSTFRLEPIQFGENTATVASQSGYAPQNSTFTSAITNTVASFRLT